MTLLGLSDCEDYFKATDKTDEFLVLWKVPAADAGEPRVAQVTAPCYFAGVIILVLLMALTLVGWLMPGFTQFNLMKKMCSN